MPNFELTRLSDLDSHVTAAFRSPGNSKDANLNTGSDRVSDVRQCLCRACNVSAEPASRNRISEDGRQRAENRACVPWRLLGVG